jgi:hypothetical protein
MSITLDNNDLLIVRILLTIGFFSCLIIGTIILVYILKLIIISIRIFRVFLSKPSPEYADTQQCKANTPQDISNTPNCIIHFLSLIKNEPIVRNASSIKYFSYYEKARGVYEPIDPITQFIQSHLSKLLHDPNSNTAKKSPSTKSELNRFVCTHVLMLK